MVSLRVGLKVRGEDQQCCHKLLSDTKKVKPEASTLVRLPCEVRHGEYQPGQNNKVADALSRKAELTALRVEMLVATSQLTLTLPDRI